MIFNFIIGTILSNKNEQSRAARKSILLLGIIGNIGLLGFFKYSDFLIDQFNFFMDTQIPILNLVLPLAISFFTFQQIAYLMDSYNGEVEEYNFFSYAMFVSFFPQLIAGPIVHHREMVPQFSLRLNKFINYSNIVSGLFVFSIGLFKKVIVADTFAIWVAEGFNKAQDATLTFFDAWATSLSYTLQLYFDFSGYTDMAIGAALLFNINLPFNFDSPYKATTIQSFWQKWHMTLSRFLREYVYIPLGGNREGHWRTFRNLMVVFLIGGLWHGAGWNFVFWGFLHGLAICIYRAWSMLGFRLPSWLSLFLTFNFVNFAFVFFRANSFKDAFGVLQGMLDVKSAIFSQNMVLIYNNIFKHPSSLMPTFKYAETQHLFGIETYFWIAIFILISLKFKNSQEIMMALRKANQPLLLKSCSVLFSALFMFGILYMSLSKYTEFIYFNF